LHIISADAKNNRFHKINSNITRLTAIFQNNPGKPVPKCLHSGFYWS